MEFHNNQYKLSGSIICSDYLNIKKDLLELEKGGVDSIHFDVMDGIFVPRYGLFPELLISIKKMTNLPIHVHLMVINPGNYVEHFIRCGAKMITIHAENSHVYQTILKIKSAKCKVGIALNPETPTSVLDYILKDIDSITIMSISPGILGQKMFPYTIDKIKDISKKISSFSQIELEVDGGVTFNSAPYMIEAGASTIVCGTGTIFQQKMSISKRVGLLARILNKLDKK